MQLLALASDLKELFGCVEVYDNHLKVSSLSTIPGIIFELKQRNPVKLDRKRKVRYLLLSCFFFFSTKIRGFSKIFNFPEILSLTSLATRETTRIPNLLY